MEPLPPRIAHLIADLRAELSAAGPIDQMLADEAVAAGLRLQLHLLQPAALDPTDDKWDRAHDRLFRRFVRCLDRLRGPRRPAPDPHGPPRRASSEVDTSPSPTPAQSPPTPQADSPSQPAPEREREREPEPEPPAPTINPTPDQPPPSALGPQPPRSHSTHRPDPAQPVHRSRQQRRREARRAGISGRPLTPPTQPARASPS